VNVGTISDVLSHCFDNQQKDWPLTLLITPQNHLFHKYIKLGAKSSTKIQSIESPWSKNVPNKISIQSGQWFMLGMLGLASFLQYPIFYTNISCFFLFVKFKLFNQSILSMTLSRTFHLKTIDFFTLWDPGSTFITIWILDKGNVLSVTIKLFFLIWYK